MINVVGLGYVGLPTALMMASHGLEVVGTDCNDKLVAELSSGVLHLKEKGVDDIYRSAMGKGIRFSTECQKAEAYIISVQTPFNKEKGCIETKYLVSAIEQINTVCEKGAIIIVESTVSPGTIEEQIRPLVKPGIHLAHAPERVLPGNMLYELEHNNRTIGVDSKEIGDRIIKYYKPFCKGEIMMTDIRTAEMSKVVENTYRAVNISFANELSRICHEERLDVNEVIKICNMHPRVQILRPGPGVGGHCISVDPRFLVEKHPEASRLIDTAVKINDEQPRFILTRIEEIMSENKVADFGRVGLYGLTYKENVDDIRNSPTLQLLDYQIGTHGTSMKSFDPFIISFIVDGQYLDFDSFLKDIDMLVVMTGHDHIRSNINKIKGKIIFDCSNTIENTVEKLYRI